MKSIVCSKCNLIIGHVAPGDELTRPINYGRDGDGVIICYACCALADKEYMRTNGRITLYLTQPSPIARQPGAIFNLEGWSITNWPGSLKFAPRGLARVSRTNWGLVRYDVWFAFDGFVWHGKNMGDSQLLHCRRTKQPSQPSPIAPRTHYIGMAGLCGYMPSYYSGVYLTRGECAQDLGDLHELSQRKIKQLRRDWYIDLDLYRDGNEYASFDICDCGLDYDDCPNHDIEG